MLIRSKISTPGASVIGWALLPAGTVVPNAAAVESAQLEPMVGNSPVGAASALLGGAILVGSVAYEDGFLSLDLALWYALLFAVYAGQVALAFVLRRRASSSMSTRKALPVHRYRSRRGARLEHRDRRRQRNTADRAGAHRSVARRWRRGGGGAQLRLSHADFSLPLPRRHRSLCPLGDLSGRRTPSDPGAHRAHLLAFEHSDDARFQQKFHPQYPPHT